jgi:hypothetical protein
MAIVHAAGITMPMFIGFDTMPMLAVSLALRHLATGGWLVTRGFDEGRRTAPVDGRGVELAGA